MWSKPLITTLEIFSTYTIWPGDLDGSHNVSLPLQYCYANLYRAVLGWSGGKCFLSRNAICDRFMVQKGWTCQEKLHFSHKQRAWDHVLRILDGCCLSFGWKRWLEGLAMVSTVSEYDENLLTSWKLFIIDGVISLPIAIAGFFVLPTWPSGNLESFLLFEDRELWSNPFEESQLPTLLQELEYGKKRMELEGRKQGGPYTKAKFKKILTSWHIYLLSLLRFSRNLGYPDRLEMGLLLHMRWWFRALGPYYGVMLIHNPPLETR